VYTVKPRLSVYMYFTKNKRILVHHVLKCELFGKPIMFIKKIFGQPGPRGLRVDAPSRAEMAQPRCSECAVPVIPRTVQEATAARRHVARRHARVNVCRAN